MKARQSDLFKEGGADLSECGHYRYRLWREWEPDGLHRPLLWVMLNPSTAHATKDDATIRRCVGFSKTRGYGALMVVNLFAYRATHPKDLLSVDDPVGPGNDEVLKAELGACFEAVAAWGVNHPKLTRPRFNAIKRWARNGLLCLGTTNAGHPKHPVRLAADTPLVWFPRAPQ